MCRHLLTRNNGIALNYAIAISASYSCLMIEINPLVQQIEDLRGRKDALRGYL